MHIYKYTYTRMYRKYIYIYTRMYTSMYIYIYTRHIQMYPKSGPGEQGAADFGASGGEP